MQREAVTITLLTDSLRPEIGTNLVTICFKLSGKTRTNVFAQIKGKKVQCSCVGDEYKFQYALKGKESKIVVQIIDSVILGSFEVAIIQSIKENTKFDI